MSKFSEYHKKIVRLLKNRTPILFIQTTDYMTEIECLKFSVFAQSGIFDWDKDKNDYKQEDLITWSPGLKYRKFLNTGDQDEKWLNCSLVRGIKEMTYDLDSSNKRVLVIEDLYHLFDKASLYTEESYIDVASALLEFFNINQRKDADARNLIIIISQKFAIPLELSSCITTIESPLPDEDDIAEELGLDKLSEDLQCYIESKEREYILKKEKRQKRNNETVREYNFPYISEGNQYKYGKSFFINRENGIVWYETQKKKLISFLVGMQISQIRAVMASEDNHISTLENLDRIKEGKERIVKESGLLRIETVPSGYEQNIGDINGLVNYIKKVIFYNKIYYKLPLPKGILLVGPPGCGKSEASRAIASLLGMPLLSLDMGSLLNKWVGDSEHNFENALAIAEAAQPCVLWIDEIEKAFAGADAKNNDDTMTRILGHLLTWMQEREKRRSSVFMVATANDLSSLRPEFLRKGRWDEIFYLTYPSSDGAWNIIKSCLNRHNLQLDKNEDQVSSTIKDIYEHYEDAIISGADLSYTIQRIYENAFCQFCKNGEMTEERQLLINSDNLILLIEKIAQKRNDTEINKIIDDEIRDIKYQLFLSRPNHPKHLSKEQETLLRTLAKEKAERDFHKNSFKVEREKELVDVKISSKISQSGLKDIKIPNGIDELLDEKYTIMEKRLQDEINDEIESVILGIKISMISQESGEDEYELSADKENRLRDLLWRKYKPQRRSEIEDYYKSKGFQSASKWEDQFTLKNGRA